MTTARVALRAGSLPRLLAPGAHARPRIRGRALIEEVRRSGLRGHGGGGFSTATKMRAVAEARGRPVVVANGTEGEPASRKDRVLMARAPDLVIGGAVAAAEAIGAREVILAVSRDGGPSARRIDAAAQRWHERPGGPRVSVVAPPARFVTGEESALVNWLNGGPAIPTLTPPRPSARGVDGRPTLVQNVETLAHVGLVAAHGADWFRRLGTAEDPGSMLVTLGGAVRAPGVHEIAPGVGLAELIDLAGGVDAGIGGVLVGGYFGTWIAGDDAPAVTFSSEGLRAAGAAIGAGTVVVLPRGACPLAETARVVTWLAGESAGQCGPCLHGLRDLSLAVRELAAAGDGGGAMREIREVVGLVEGRGACRHPDGVTRLVRSALRAFPGELELHLRGLCSATDRRPVLPVPAPAAGRR